MFTYLLGHATDRAAKFGGLLAQTSSLTYERFISHLYTVTTKVGTNLYPSGLNDN